MNENQECEIIKDLLPSYIEGLTSERTNEFIEQHLKKCSSCKNSYEIMSADINITTNSASNKKINIFKRINRKIRILQTIIFCIIIVYVVIYAINLFTLNKIVALSESNNFNNFYQKEVKTTEKFSRTLEYYQRDNNLLYISTTVYQNNDVERRIEGMLHGEYFFYCEKNGIDTSTNKIINTEVSPLLQWPFLNKTGNVGIALIPGIIKNITLNGKNCYLISIENDMFFIDKETGMEIKRIHPSDNTIYDRHYSFGTVTDEIIEELISKYKK